MQQILERDGDLSLHRGSSIEPVDADRLLNQYRDVRAATEKLCEPLEVDDYLLQAMPEASPVKWQLAHTTWFFESFVLETHQPDFQPFHPDYRHLFNSYYQAVGPQWPRTQRGLIARPTVEEVFRYRGHVDDMVEELLMT